MLRTGISPSGQEILIIINILVKCKLWKNAVDNLLRKKDKCHLGAVLYHRHFLLRKESNRINSRAITVLNVINIQRNIFQWRYQCDVICKNNKSTVCWQVGTKLIIKKLTNLEDIRNIQNVILLFQTHWHYIQNIYNYFAIVWNIGVLLKMFSN